jgi:hypothetical protein
MTQIEILDRDYCEQVCETYEDSVDYSKVFLSLMFYEKNKPEVSQTH